MKFETSVGGKTGALTIETSRLRYECEGETPLEREFSFEPLEPGAYSVVIDGRSYEAVIGSGPEIRVNGRMFSVEIFDPRSMRGRKTKSEGAGRQNITSSMPGKVVRLLVSEGDEVEAGQGLIVVEAMKMQNEMKSPKAGRVVEVKTRTDATVAAGEVLIVIE